MLTNSIFLISLLITGCTACLVLGWRARRAGNVWTATMANGAASSIPNLRAAEMERPLLERTIKPMLRHLHQFGKAFTPKRSIETIQRNLIMAGLPGGLTVTDFVGLRFLAGTGMGLFAAMAINGRYGFSITLLAGLSGFMLGLYLPNFWLKSRVRRRQKEIALSLPDGLDMMSICVEAGLGFEAAMQKVATKSDSELAVEFQRVISEIRVGVRRIDALRHMVERTGVPDVASFVAVLVQADKLGVAIRDVLNTQAEQMRIRRRQRAEEEARKAPLKMLFPLVMFIFPALFAVILGPAVPRMIRLLGG